MSDSIHLHRASLAGDENSLQKLLVRHLADLRAFVRLRMSPLLRQKESCSDLVQAVCLEILRNPGQVAYEGEAAFRNWLYGAVLQAILKRQRFYLAQKRAAQREDPLSEGIGDLRRSYAAFRSPSQVAVTREEIEKIEAAFDQLEPEQREVITLKQIVGLSHAEISAQLEKTEGAVRMVLHRGLARLSTLLDR